MVADEYTQPANVVYHYPYMLRRRLCKGIDIYNLWLNHLFIDFVLVGGSSRFGWSRLAA